jgi:tRNA pseudouridine55 synthase
MNNILNVYKPKYVTPLQIIDAVKKQFSDYKDLPITYAGRLDPLASGVLLLLADDAIDKKEYYLQLPKTYEFQVLFGISTDTYDTLGLIQSVYSHSLESGNPDLNNTLHTICEKFVKQKNGKHIQSYPPFSSKTVNGKPLFWWAKNNRLSEIQIPSREIEIFSFEIIKQMTITTHHLLAMIEEQTLKVSGDFRQKEILLNWNDHFKDRHISFPILHFRINCSSGTYVRALAHELGTLTEMGAIAIDIKRIAVGEYRIDTSQIIMQQTP